jgi:hypothetical protein
MAGLPDEQYGHLSRALNEYCFFGIEPELSGIEKIIFTMAKPNINSSINQKIAGKKGAFKGGSVRGPTEGAPEGGFQRGPTEGAPIAPCDSPPDKPPIEGGYDSKGEGEGEGEEKGERKREGESEPADSFFPPQTHGEEEKPPEGPAKSKEDAATLFNKSRELWNSLNLPPGCRDIIIPPAEVPDVLRTFQNYSWKEIANAIENYDWHKNYAGNEYRPPPPYGSLYGFLKKGVVRYYKDEDVKKQFREGKDVPKKR